MTQPPHGTRRAYHAGCRCVACRAAEATYRAQCRLAHAEGRLLPGSLVPGTLTARRIRALEAELFTRQAIARRLGLGLRGRQARVHTHARVRFSTHCRMLRLWLELGMDA